MLGCGDERPETAHAVEIARAHAGDLGSFERWARRVAASETQYRDRAAFEEAAFAQVRGIDRVEAAWIDRRGPDPSSLAYPSGARIPRELAWRRIRLEGLGEHEVALEVDREYVRRAVSAPGGAHLVLTLAFARRPRGSR